MGAGGATRPRRRGARYGEAQETIATAGVFAIVGPSAPNHVRYEPHDQVVGASPDAAHVFVAGSMFERAARPRLEQRRFRRLVRCGFAIYARRR